MITAILTDEGHSHITQIPEIANWDDDYISLSGFCGIHGPHVFAAAPELLEALELLMQFAPNRFQDDFEYERGCFEHAADIIKKAKGSTP